MIFTEASPVETLQNQFSGYGSTTTVVARCLDKLAIKEPLPEWSDETIESVVNAFIDEKFPTVIALNKIDHQDADKVGQSCSVLSSLVRHVFICGHSVLILTFLSIR